MLLQGCSDLSAAIANQELQTGVNWFEIDFAGLQEAGLNNPGLKRRLNNDI